MDQENAQSDWWKHEPANPEYTLPVVFTSIAPPMSDDVQVALHAQQLISGKSLIPRKDVEYYARIREDDEKARNFLLMLLEAHHDNSLYASEPGPRVSMSPPLTEEEKQHGYTMTNKEMEEMFGLDMLIKALALLRSEAR